jgi:putative transposase
MTRSRYKMYDKEIPHFLTMTTVDWIPLFANRDIVSIILESLRFAQRERGVVLYAYVIMENHLHCIASAPELGKTMKQFKSFTARSAVDYLEECNNLPLLEKMQWAKLPHKKKCDYQLWQEGNHPEAIYSEEMLLQKIEYIHSNPVRRGWVDEPAQWRYSSARNYEGRQDCWRCERTGGMGKGCNEAEL